MNSGAFCDLLGYQYNLPNCHVDFKRLPVDEGALMQE